MNSDWNVVVNIILIFVMMFVAKLIKEKLGIFKSIIIPTSLLAGFIGFALGPEVIGAIQFDTVLYEKLVFHSMGLGFIALTLSEESIKQRTDSVKSGFIYYFHLLFSRLLSACWFYWDSYLPSSLIYL